MICHERTNHADLHHGGVQVSADPAPLDTDRTPPPAAFPIQIVRGPGDSPAAAAVEAGEVMCRGPLARAALASLRAGDTVLVTGSVELRTPAGMDRDCSPVLLTIEANHIGRSLSPAE